LIRYDATMAADYRERSLKRVEADVRECYQCGNCSAGCPAAFTFDYTPNQMMRMLQVGLVDKVLDSKAVQLCLQCLTCTERCPRNINIAGIFEDLKTVAAAQERDVPEHVKTFNGAFLRSIARFGRLPELYSMAMFYLGTRNPKMALGDVGLMTPMLSKGKMKIFPRRARGADEVGHIYKRSLERAREAAKAESRSRRAATPASTVAAGVAGSGEVKS
jgi:heterodisulfide reductase subunit C